MHADAWAALAQWVTAAIALGAAVFAYFQVIEARRTRERVAQPDVVVFIDHNPVNWHYMDLVIKNLGQTPAYNIRIKLPPLQVVPFENESTGEQVTTHYVPTNIAVLAPGQEWRSAWESGIEIENYEGDLPSNYVGSVHFDDKMNADKPSFENPISLDINMFRDTHQISREKSRTVEKALYEISGTLKGYKRQHHGIWVYTVNGEDEYNYHRGNAERARQQHDKITRKLRGEGDE
jgi:hypothetical protein